jgi:hypothetical protein
MKRNTALSLIALAFIAGITIGYLLSPYISIFGKSYKQVSEEIIVASLQENMKTIEKTVEKYASKYGHYPKMSSISWLEKELPLDFENPITYKTGEGKAYMSGSADKPGIIGFESDSTGSYCRITAYGVEVAIELSLAPKAPKEVKIKETKEGKFTSEKIEVSEEEKVESTWNIFGVNTKVTEKSNDKWKFFWEFTIYNQEKESIFLTAIVEFLNKESEILEEEILQNIDIPGESSKTFNGYTLINADMADRIKEINIKASREKFVQQE